MDDTGEATRNGDICEECGTYIGKGKGHTRLCDSCIDAHTDDLEREMFGDDADFLDSPGHK